MKPLNIGIIGYGFMGRAHSNAFKQANHFFDLPYRPVLRAACGRDREKIDAFARRWGWETTETNWKKVVNREDIDVIDIASPNNTHKAIVLEAAKAGKMVLCEKPLAMNGKEGLEMTNAIEKAGVANMVWFNYRRVPAIALAKRLVDEGRLGKVFHYRAKYLQDWTISADLPQGGAALWRLDAKVAGSGVLGDLLAHSIDTAIWLNGRMDKVTGLTETFIKERKHNLTGKVQKVGIDDACAFLVRFENGSLGTFESTRYARGRKNQNTFEINGENASIFFDLEDPHRLSYFDHGHDSSSRGWSSIHVTDFEHPYMGNYWVPGTTIGYEHTFVNAFADFLAGLGTKKPARPDFRDALETQYVCDAVQRSAKSGKWEKVSQAMSGPKKKKKKK